MVAMHAISAVVLESGLESLFLGLGLGTRPTVTRAESLRHMTHLCIRSQKSCNKLNSLQIVVFSEPGN